ncbi:MAG: protease, partial [Fusobacteria bacterium]
MKIIAPAGDRERLEAAIKGGANEVYLGLKGFGARRSAINFTVGELKEAIDYAHLRGVRVLLTLNTIMKDAELESLYMNLSALYEHGLDAVIVQ